LIENAIGFFPMQINSLKLYHETLDYFERLVYHRSLNGEEGESSAKPYDDSCLDFIKKFDSLYEIYLKGNVDHLSMADQRSILTQFRSTLYATIRNIKDSDAYRDHETGLMSATRMHIDFEKEMNRVERQDVSVCLIFVHIIEIKALFESQGRENVFIQIGNIIDDTVRSFDDSYRCEEDSFLLILKNADKKIGVIAAERLRQNALQQSKIIHDHLHYLIAEPTVGDKLSDLLDVIKQEITQDISESGIVEHKESSPLQRYIESLKDPIA